MFDVKHEQQEKIVILSPAGRLDAVAAPELERKCHELLDDGKKAFLLDLAGLDFVASAGLRVFLAFAKLVKKADGQLVFCCLRDEVLEVFRITGFTDIFSVCASRKEAIDALQP